MSKPMSETTLKEFLTCVTEEEGCRDLLFRIKSLFKAAQVAGLSPFVQREPDTRMWLSVGFLQIEPNGTMTIDGDVIMDAEAGYAGSAARLGWLLSSIPALAEVRDYDFIGDMPIPSKLGRLTAKEFDALCTLIHPDQFSRS